MTTPRLRPDPGCGVFETLLARDGRAQALELHLERLGRAIDELYGEPAPDDLGERVRSTATQLTQPHRLRIDAIPGESGLAIAIAATPVDAMASAAASVTLRPVVVPGGIGRHKWRDRRLLDALDDGRSIPLILDADEEVLEAGRMNVWIREGRRIITPPADGRLLAGVTRALLLTLAPTLELEAAQEPVTLARARAADAIFVTSSIRHAAGAVLSDGTGPPSDQATVATIRTALDGAGWT